MCYVKYHLVIPGCVNSCFSLQDKDVCCSAGFCHRAINLQMKPHSQTKDPVASSRHETVTSPGSCTSCQGQASSSAKSLAARPARSQVLAALLQKAPSRVPKTERIPPRRWAPAEGLAEPVATHGSAPGRRSSPAAPSALPTGPSGRRARRPGLPTRPQPAAPQPGPAERQTWHWPRREAPLPARWEPLPPRAPGPVPVTPDAVEQLHEGEGEVEAEEEEEVAGGLVR